MKALALVETVSAAVWGFAALVPVDFAGFAAGLVDSVALVFVAPVAVSVVLVTVSVALAVAGFAEWLVEFVAVVVASEQAT